MFRSLASTGPRPRRTGGFFSVLTASALLSAALLLAAPAAAQQPTRPDTANRPRPDTAGRIGPDTSALRPDTGAAPAPRDTTPPPQLPAFDRVVPAGFSTGVWIFTRDSLERFASAVTLADLLELIPGITRVHSGYFVQPEAVTSLGQMAGRVEVFLDGYALSPLASGVPDLSRIEMAQIGTLRIERRMDALRIDIISLSPSTPQPYAFIQAGVAEPNGKLFRGGFLAPHFLIGPFAFGVDRLDTNGTGGAEKGDETGAWLQWGRIWRDRGGLQLEARTNTVHRNEGVPWAGTSSRRDLTLRGRWRLLPGLVGEAYIGGSGVKDPNLVPDTASGFSKRFQPPALPAIPGPTSTPADTANYLRILALQRDTLLDRSDRQIGARLNYVGPVVWGDAALRTHSADRLAKLEGDVTAGFRLAGMGDADAGLHLESWNDRQVSDSHLRGRVGPFRGFSAFAELSSGERGVPFLRDTAAGQDLFVKRSSWRAGVDLDRPWLSAGIARLSVTNDSIPGFGLPFDLSTRFYPAGSMSGWESHARVRLFWRPLSAEYWYVVWTQFKLPAVAEVESIVQPIYTPDQEYRASLVYHQLPLKSGHLELYARLDARSRGNAFAAVAPATVVPPVNSLDFYLQIRIIDVRIFFHEVGMTQQQGVRPFDIPNRAYPAPRIYYGVRWQFFD